MTADAATAARPRGVGVDAITPDLAYPAALAAVLAAAFGLQAGLFGIGFHSISFDESAR